MLDDALFLFGGEDADGQNSLALDYGVAAHGCEGTTDKYGQECEGGVGISAFPQPVVFRQVVQDANEDESVGI